MQHFSEQAWADFVRGISESETKANIETHLARGCSDCRATSDVWNRLQTTAANERTYTPPENAVRMVKQEFAAMNSSKETSVLANLLFDTLAQPVSAGIRSGAAVARQLVYEAEGLTVDLRLDSQPHSGKVLVVGQVLDKRHPRVSPIAVSIALWTPKGQPFLEVSPNESGEFQLEVDAQDDLRLLIEVAGRKTIRIPLANFGQSNVAG
jgi:hypothetical protein